MHRYNAFSLRITSLYMSPEVQLRQRISAHMHIPKAADIHLMHQTNAHLVQLTLAGSAWRPCLGAGWWRTAS